MTSILNLLKSLESMESQLASIILTVVREIMLFLARLGIALGAAVAFLQFLLPKPGLTASSGRAA